MPERRPPSLKAQEQTEPNGEAQFAWPERCLAESQLGRRRQKQPEREQRIQNHGIAPAIGGRAGWSNARFASATH